MALILKILVPNGKNKPHNIHFYYLKLKICNFKAALEYLIVNWYLWTYVLFSSSALYCLEMPTTTFLKLLLVTSNVLSGILGHLFSIKLFCREQKSNDFSVFFFLLYFFNIKKTNQITKIFCHFLHWYLGVYIFACDKM